jgi:N utilization substance protein B
VSITDNAGSGTFFMEAEELPSAETSTGEGGWARRRQAREQAMGLLYEAEMRHEDPLVVLESREGILEPYAAWLVREATLRHQRLDELIAAKLEHWSLERMAVLDRMICYLALAEMLTGAVPDSVAISEAVEIAKRYSTEDSSAFVNGLLGSIQREDLGRNEQAS